MKLRLSKTPRILSKPRGIEFTLAMRELLSLNFLTDGQLTDPEYAHELLKNPMFLEAKYIAPANFS